MQRTLHSGVLVLAMLYTASSYSACLDFNESEPMAVTVSGTLMRGAAGAGYRLRLDQAVCLHVHGLYRGAYTLRMKEVLLHVVPDRDGDCRRCRRALGRHATVSGIPTVSDDALARVVLDEARIEDDEAPSSRPRHHGEVIPDDDMGE